MIALVSGMECEGYFVSLFMDTIKAKSYKVVEKKEFENIEISTYLVDELYYVNIINKYKGFWR